MRALTARCAPGHPPGDLVPFDALLDEHGHYLVESYAVMYLSSGNDLVHLDQMRASQTRPVVMGGAAFGSGAAALQFDDLGLARRGRSGRAPAERPRLLAAGAATKAALGPMP